MSNNWLVIMGSSRRHQNTERIVDYMIDALEALGRNVEKVCLSSDNIATCDGCDMCLQTGKCQKNDEVSQVIEMISGAEGIIIASPTYHKGMSAQIKAFLDRTHVFSSNQNEFKPPYGVVVGVCKGMTKDAMGNTVEGIKNILESLDIEIIDVVEYYNTDIFPVEKNEMIKDVIEQRVYQIMAERGMNNVN